MSLRNVFNDATQTTVDGFQNVTYGHYDSHLCSGGDRSAGSGKTEEHNYSAQHQSRTYGYYRWHVATNPGYFGYSSIHVACDSPTWDSNDELALIGKLREAFDQTSFNGGNFVGELPQTVGLLGGKVGLLRNAVALAMGGAKKAYQPYRKGKRKSPAKRKPKTGDSLIGDSWLEFSFGVMPLINDVYDLAEIASKQNTLRKTITVRKGGKPGSCYTNYPDVITTDGQHTFSKQIIARLEQESVPSFWEQFGLADPATIAWELLPWSFVVDWALPIGKFVEAQSFARRMKGTFIVTSRDKLRWSGSLSSSTDGIYTIEQKLGEGGSTVGIQRVIASTLNVPIPSLKSNLLGGKPLWRLANALALLGQVTK